MKVNFSRSSVYIPEWNNNRDDANPFGATMKPAELGDLLDIVDAFSKIGAELVDTNTTDMKDMRQVVDACSEILPKYVVLTGLVDTDSNPLDIDTVLKYLVFTPLAVELLGKLCEISTPDGKEDEGN